MDSKNCNRLNRIEDGGRKGFGKYRCICGEIKELQDYKVRSNHTKSCGCLRNEGPPKGLRTKHGKHKTAEYAVWHHMKQRCYDKNYPSYSEWGGRGIKVCERWRESFENFLADMGERPSKDHSIDRKDNDGDYEPGNCRWATRQQQHRNKRNTRSLTLDGETKTIGEWAEVTGLSTSLIWVRVFQNGWTPERALRTIPKKQF